MPELKLKRGDTSPNKPGLVFLCYCRGRERWVTPATIDRYKAKSKEWQKRWQETADYKETFRKRNKTETHKAKLKAYRSTPEYRARQKELRREKRDDLNAKSLARYYRNHAKHLANNRTPKIRAKYKANWKRWSQTERGKLEVSLRRRIGNAMRAGKCKRQGCVFDLLGCDIDAFKIHLQSQFKRGMSWNNHGVFWEIDHIKPIAKFDLTKPSEQRAAFHFSNCQPLWKDENRRKSAKYHEISV